MRRFFLCSLSATVAIAVGAIGSTANAETRHETNHSQVSNGLVAQTSDPIEGILSPTDQSPNNRAVPGSGAIEGEAGPTETRGENLTEGILSPTDQSPNNRAIPQGGSVETEEPMNTCNPDLTAGVISPDDQCANNRAVPGSGAVESTESSSEGATTGSEANTGNTYDDAPADSIMESSEDYPTEGILSPDSNGPNNRATPQGGAVEPNMSPMMEDRMQSPTDGILSPNSEGPNNRAVPQGEAVEPNPSYDNEAEDSAPTEGILSPDSDGPNNRAIPGSGAIE